MWDKKRARAQPTEAKGLPLADALAKKNKAGSVAETPAPVVEKPRRHKRPKVAATLYLEPDLDDELDDILKSRKGHKSPYTGQKLRKHDLYLEAIDLLLAQEGKVSIADLIKKDGG